MTDTASSESPNPSRESHLVGCSVTGPDHEETGEPCQDAWAGKKLSDSRFVFAVADGLGSASHAHVGSELATETITSHVADAVTEVDKLEQTYLRDTFQTGYETVRSAIRDEADQRNLSMSDLNTTLLAAAGGPSGVAAAAVGDGGIVRVYRDEFHLFVPREGREYANRTIPVQSDGWEDSYRFEYSKEVDGVAAFSDGLENFAWDSRTSVQDTLFEQLFNCVWYTTDSDQIKEEFSEFLNHERFRNISNDDKTIAIATLDIDYQNREPKPTTDQTESATEGGENNASEEPTPDATQSESPTASTASGSRSQRAEEGLSTGKRADAYEDDFVGTDGLDDDYLYLTKQIGSDSTGALYLTSNDERPMVKILALDKRNDTWETKLDAMTETSPSPPDSTRGNRVVYQWPRNLVTRYHGTEVLGCAYDTKVPMDGQTIHEFAQEGPKAESLSSWLGAFFKRRNKGPPRPGMPRYETAVDLATAIKALHQQDIAVGDFDHHTIHVTDNTLVLSACDRYSLDDGTAYYSETTSHGRYLSGEVPEDSLKRAQYADRFGLAVHLYQLLLDGAHPFSLDAFGVEQRIEKDRIKKHLTNNLSDINPGAADEAKAYAGLPRTVRFQFEKCFVEGFDSPEERPSAHQWMEALIDQMK